MKTGKSFRKEYKYKLFGTKITFPYEATEN